MGNEAAERTEEATARRKNKERERGNVSRSRDLEAALVMIAGVSLLLLLSNHMYNTIELMMKETFNSAGTTNIDVNNISGLLFPYFRDLGLIVLPFLLLLVIVTIVVVRMDVGPVFAVSKVKIDFENLSPRKMLNNAKNIINPLQPRSLVEFVKSILKLVIVGACGYAAINSRRSDLLGMIGLEFPVAAGIISSILVKMIINMCLAMLVLGFLDKKYQDYEYNKSIKMTKQEVKDEHKDIEGDPQIKAKIRSIQMQMAKQRMMSSVPEADVVVTNPTHYAVAIKYDVSQAPVPLVIAKGVDYLAFQIRDIAKTNNVPIVENRPVARTLYNTVPINGQIPVDMYVAVSEILAYVYRNRQNND